MRCQRCEFENMPGIVKCLRCGSVLAGFVAAVQVHPPRMSRWKKPFRRLERGLRKVLPFSVPSRVPLWLNKAVEIAFFGAALSIVPGLAHLIQGRFKVIRLWVVLWAVLLFLGLFLYGSNWGLLLVGLGLGLHVWIAVHSALVREYQSFTFRMIAFLIGLFFYYTIYFAAGHAVFHNIAGGHATVSVPAARIQPGDYLLGRPGVAPHEHLRSGSIVLAELRGLGYRPHVLPAFRNPNWFYVQVIGIDGDKIAAADGRFVLNDQPLDPEEFAVPEWLVNLKFEMIIPPNSFFINAQFSGTGYNEHHIEAVCIVPADRIRAKAFYRWMPLTRRGAIRESQ